MTTPALTELYAYDVSVPAGTSSAAPQTTNLAMPARVVDRIEVVFPPGPNGLVGVAIAMAGQQVMPANAGAWVIASGETVGHDQLGLPESGAWQVRAYNTGVFAHAVHLRFWVHVNRPAIVTPAFVTPDLSQLTSFTQAGVDALVAEAEASAELDVGA